jgi:predicted Zn-dependent protease
MVLVVVAGLLSGPVWGDELTIEQEKKMGEQFRKAALRYLPIIEDPEVTGYANRVGHRLVKHLKSKVFSYNFYVVNSNTLNAFAAPAGYIFINSGLIDIMDTEDELAAILAHEIAHVQSRHISQRIARRQKLNYAALGGLLAGLFLGAGNPAVGQALSQGAMAGAVSTELSYSRMDEEEADRKGILYMEAAGYPPSALVSIMRKMGQDSWKAGGRMPTYLSTHPGVSERVTYLATVVESRPEPPKNLKTEKAESESFNMVQTKLLGAYAGVSEAQGIFRSWRQDPEKKVMSYYGMGLLLRRQGKMEEAAMSLKLAIAMRPDLAPILVELGETYYLMGKMDRALSVLDSALSLDPNQIGAMYMQGRCLLEMGRTKEALSKLITAYRLNDQLPSIQYYLGMAYGQLDQLGQAHYHFGMYQLQRGSRRSARFHFQEALKHCRDPKLKSSIEKELTAVNAEIRKEEQNKNSR